MNFDLSADSGAYLLPSSELFHLPDALTQLIPHDAGKRSMSLIKTDQLRVVLIRMSVGGEMHEHSAPGQITIHPLSGQFDVTVEGKTETLTSASLLTIEARVLHSVRCTEDGAFLLTIAWNPNIRSHMDLSSDADD